MSEMNSLRAELTELIGNCSLPEHEKSILLNGDEESSNAVLKSEYLLFFVSDVSLATFILSFSFSLYILCLT